MSSQKYTARQNLWRSKTDQNGETTISDSTNIDGKRVVIGFYRTHHDGGDVWNVILTVGATRKIKKSVRTQATWPDGYSQRTTGSGSLKPFIWALGRMDEFQRANPHVILVVRPEDDKRLKSYKILLRRGFSQGTYFGNLVFFRTGPAYQTYILSQANAALRGELSRRNPPVPMNSTQKEALWALYSSGDPAAREQAIEIYSQLGYPYPDFSDAKLDFSAWPPPSASPDAVYRDIDFSGVVAKSEILLRDTLVDINFYRLRANKLILGFITGTRLNFSEARANFFHIVGGYHLNCNFSGTESHEFTVSDNANFNNCDFSKAKLSVSKWRSVRMDGGSLREANLSLSTLHSMVCVNVDIVGLNLSGANMRPDTIVQIRPKNIDFSGLNVRGADLRGLRLSCGWAPLEKAIRQGLVRFDARTLWPRGIYIPGVTYY